MNKITGKQEVVGGFDLNSFVEDVEAVPATPAASKPAKKKPATIAKEQLTERVQMKITKSEMAKLEKEIGLVPVSKWLRHHLKEQGVI